MDFRDIKNRARTLLHGVMKVRALYIVGSEDPVLVTVRPHTRFDALGEVAGTSFDYAERREILPRIIFMRDQVEQPARLSIVSLGEDEAYRVDHSDPPDGISVTAFATRITAQERAALPTPLPYPGDENYPTALWDDL